MADSINKEIILAEDEYRPRMPDTDASATGGWDAAF